VSKTALGPTQPPIRWEAEDLSLGVERQGRAADYSPPSSAEVKERVEQYLHTPNTPSCRGDQLKHMHRDNFTFYFYWGPQTEDNLTEKQLRIPALQEDETEMGSSLG